MFTISKDKQSTSFKLKIVLFYEYLDGARFYTCAYFESGGQETRGNDVEAKQDKTERTAQATVERPDGRRS